MPTMMTHIVSSVSRRAGRKSGWMAAVVCAAVLAPTAARATTFPGQSLIIPTQSSYQDACGMVSTYGLVYSVLRANDGWRAAPKTTGHFSAPITIHWVYSATKKSPNRCVPTNVDKVFAGSTVQTTTATSFFADTTWNDGCDFKVDLGTTGGAPVTLVNNSNTAVADLGLGNTSWSTFDTTTAFGTVMAFPNFKSQPIKKVLPITSTTVTAMQYSGGAFIISAADAPGFLDLLSGTAVVNDAQGFAIDFSAFRNNGSSTSGSTGVDGTCNAGINSSNANQAVFGSSGSTGNFTANVHHVNIHRAQTNFTAEDNALMNGAPPKIGLLQSVDHDYADETGTSVLTKDCRGGTGGCGGSTNDPVNGGPIVGTPTGIKGTQLKFYLQSAGLNFAQAGGCAPGSYNDPSVNSYDSTTAGLCPNGKGVSGQIYDNLDAIDLATGFATGTDGKLTVQPNGKPNYAVIWAPHWEGRPWKSAGGSTGCDATCIANAQANLAAFLDNRDVPRGFLAECATIGFLEGAVNRTEASTFTGSCSPGFTNSDPTGKVVNGCFPNERYINDTPGTQSLTCQKNGSGTCATQAATSPAPIGLNHDLADHLRPLASTSDSGTRLDNCTDPTTGSGKSCIHYANPSSAFAQIGDYRWWSYSGGVSNYFPSSTATYTTGAQRLLFTVSSLDTTVIKTNPTSLATADNVTLIQRGGDKKKAQMVYLGGHNYTADVAGTRIALNTLMALGLIVDTQESAFVGPTVFQNTVVIPTYNRITSTGVPASYHAFDPSQPSLWEFPYHTGNLRVDSLTAVATGSFTSNNLYSASIPLPAQRKLFTYLGGHVSTKNSDLPLSYQSQFGHGIAQVGWKPVNFDQSSLNPGASFIDAYHIGPVPVPVPGNGPPTGQTYPGMVLGGTSPSISDLQEALELTITAQDLTTDNGAAEQSAIVSKLSSSTEINNTKWLIQMVRGFCYPTAPLTNFAPADTDCVQFNANNSAEIGALVHSQPAVVPASPLINDAPVGKHRPTVAYVGGLDGQLHAFYMPSSDGLDAGYTGPAAVLPPLTANDVNPSAGSITNPGGSFAIPTSGIELWAFIPPGQLPFLKTNAAQVDSSPAVSDVFGDFDGSGIRTWRTVLVASAGGSNREVFALDITNPLSPTLLWDIQSSFDTTQLPYAPAVLAADDTGLGSNAKAFIWQNRCRAADVSAATCASTQYALPPAIDAGRIDSGLFNYGHLGASQSVSVGVLRRNNAPVFAAFVATNEAGGNGIYVFGIDMVTGTKLWEWNNPYDPQSYPSSQPNRLAGVGNTAPAGVAVVSRSLDDQVNSVYAGDDEGSLWELDAEDGINNTGYSAAQPVGVGCGDKGGACNYSLNQAYGYDQVLFGNADIPQPISTLPTVFTIRSDIPPTGVFSKYVGQSMLAYGTAGTDAVAGITSSTLPASGVSGAIHLMPIGISARDVPSDLTSGAQATTKTTHAQKQGVVYEAGLGKDGSGTALFPQALAGGNRVYGSISADQNGRLFFGTTTGSVTNIDSRGSLTGNVYQIDTSSTAQAALLTTVQNGTGIGGVGGKVAIGYNGTQAVLIVSTDKGLVVPAPAAATLQAPPAGTQPPAAGLLGWFLRKAGREY
jgi:type IV pilus assembly protein PilY1